MPSCVERLKRFRPQFPRQVQVRVVHALRSLRVRLKIIGNLETMHESDLHAFLIISFPIIFKRTVDG